MMKRINLMFLLAICLLLTGCDTNVSLNIGGGSGEGVGTPTVVTDTSNNVVSTTTVIEAKTGSTMSFEGLAGTYKVGDVAKFDIAFQNRSGGVLSMDYKVRLMNQDQARPQEYAYGTSDGNLLVYPAQTQRISQGIQIPTNLAPGTYVMNVYITKVNKDNSTTVAQGISLSQTVNVTQ